MKKILTTLFILTLTLFGCTQTPPAEESSQSQTIVNDIYTVTVPAAWQYEPITYGANLPVSAGQFTIDGQLVAQVRLLEVPAGDLSLLPGAIKVTEVKRANDLIIGTIEVIDDATGGDTASQAHILVPVSPDNDHEYIDLQFAPNTLEETAQLAIAQSVTLRNRQYLAYIRQLNDEEIVFDPVELIMADETERIAQLNLSESDFAQGAALYNDDATTTKAALGAESCYYLVDGDSFVTVTYDQLADFWAANENHLFYIDLLDDMAIAIEAYHSF